MLAVKEETRSTDLTAGNSLEDAEMKPQLASDHLPYDVLLQIFKAVAALREDSLEGSTATWALTSTTTDLLSCSLVHRDWTLPAQQVLFHGVRLTTLEGITRFVETSISKPDLAQSTRVLSIDPEMVEMFTLPGALSPRIVEAVAFCSNVHTLQVTSIAPSYTPLLRQVIKSLPLLTSLLFGDTRDPYCYEIAHSTYCLAHTLKDLPSLRRLEFGFPLGYTHAAEEGPLPLPLPSKLTTLALTSTHHRAELHLLKALGPQLVQLSYTHNEADYRSHLRGERAFITWSLMLNSLRQLRIDINATDPQRAGDWICALLPRFTQLERFSFSTTLSSTALIPSLPSSVTLLEILSHDSDCDTFDQLEQIANCIKGLGNKFKVGTLVFDAFGAWWDPVLTGRSRDPGYGERAASVLLDFERVMRKREVEFVKCYPEIRPPFFVEG